MRLGIALSSTFLAILACGGGLPPGRVRAGQPVVTQGSVDTDELIAALDRFGPALEACYVQALRQNHAVEGTVTLQLEGQGRNLSAAIQSNTTGDDSLASCAQRFIHSEGEGLPPDTQWDFTAEWPVQFSITREP